MNATIRNLVPAAYSTKSDMTAHEMTLTPIRSQSRDGNMVITKDGTVYTWNPTIERWTPRVPTYWSETLGQYVTIPEN